MDAKKIAKKIKTLEINTNKKVNEVFVGNYKSSFRGQGLEVSDLRKYEEGDDARHIDWIITARQGSPYVKKFRETRELTTMLLVDVSASMDFTTSGKTKSESSLEILAYILFSALKNNDKFGAIIFSDKVHSHIPPKKGRKHLLHILREVIIGFENKQKGETNINIALDSLNRFLKKRSICFFLSDNLLDHNRQSKKDLMPLKIANQKHDFIYINIYDKFEKKIDEKYPLIKMINPENGESEYINLGNKRIIENYNKIRLAKAIKETEILNKNSIDSLYISNEHNIYKELLLFFKKRALRY